MQELCRRHKPVLGSKIDRIWAVYLADSDPGRKADTGFRARPEEMSKVQEHVETLAVPGRDQSRTKIDTGWHHFRVGIEGSISLKKGGSAVDLPISRIQEFRGGREHGRVLPQSGQPGAEVTPR